MGMGMVTREVDMLLLSSIIYYSQYCPKVNVRGRMLSHHPCIVLYRLSEDYCVFSKMSRKGKVEYVKQMPKFLQEFKAQNPEIDRNANLKAIAAAHEERDKAERPIREDELPVIVNLQEYESELKQDKLLYQELTGKDADNETQDETVRDDNEMHNEAVYDGGRGWVGMEMEMEMEELEWD